MSNKHTPGPWSISRRSGIVVKRTTDSFARRGKIALVAKHHTDVTGDERRANAKLIAAAPQLLENLIELLDNYQSLLGCMSTESNGDEELIKSAKAAIDKATL